MYHSITFTDKSEDELNEGGFTQTPTGLLLNGINTWDEWHLIPSSRPDIAMPGISEKYLEIPGRDGSIDLSEWLAGRITFGDREGSLEFYHQNGYEDYETVRRSMAHYFHGRKLKMILEDDPGYYYQGRFKLNGWKSDASHSKVVIDYRLEPYKWDILSRIAPKDWPWDTFMLERDRDYWFHVPEMKTSGTVVYRSGQFVRYNAAIYRFTSNYSGAWNSALNSAVLVLVYSSTGSYSTGDYAVRNGHVMQKTASSWALVPNSYFYWYAVPTYSRGTTYRAGQIVKNSDGLLYCFLADHPANIAEWNDSWWVPVVRVYGNNLETYKAGEYVSYNGKIYKFVRDWNGNAWSDSWWEKIPEYDDNTAYTQNQHVIYNGGIYKWNRDYNRHAWSDTWWKKIAEYDDNSVYVYGDYVFHEGEIYRLTTANIGGTEWDGSKWTKVVSAYSDSGTYTVGTIVTYKNSIYKFTHSYTGGTAWNDSYWTEYKTYTSTGMYAAGDYVWYNGNWYIFTTAYNGPDAWSNSWWTLQISLSSVSEYSSKGSYQIGSFVYYKGDYYRFKVAYNGPEYWDDSLWTEIVNPVIGELNIHGYKTIRLKIQFRNESSNALTGFVSAYGNSGYRKGSDVVYNAYRSDGDMNDEHTIYIFGTPGAVSFRGGQL